MNPFLDSPEAQAVQLSGAVPCRRDEMSVVDSAYSLGSMIPCKNCRRSPSSFSDFDAAPVWEIGQFWPPPADGVGSRAQRACPIGVHWLEACNGVLASGAVPCRRDEMSVVDSAYSLGSTIPCKNCGRSPSSFSDFDAAPVGNGAISALSCQWSRLKEHKGHVRSVSIGSLGGKEPAY